MKDQDEKKLDSSPQITAYDDVDSNELTHSEAPQAPAQCPPSINERALVRRIDFRVLPVLFVIYLAAFLDRVNISNALVLNLPKDLHLSGVQPNIALTIFFVPYVLFEIPSNILMKRFKPHVWLSGCILAFGLVMLCQGFVTNYSGLLATRFFLGLAEAGIFPGSFYLISFWYKREEAQPRFTVYWCSVLTANAFGGLLASAIATMDGIRGYSSWRWIFILEGIATILIGLSSYFLVSDFPEDVSWLNEEERRFVVARAGTKRQTGQTVTVRNVKWIFSDVKNILAALLYFSIIVPTYAYAYFAPTIIKTLKYSTIQTQLHSVPPVAVALGLCLLLAYLSHATGLRYPFVAFSQAVLITGLAILSKVHHSFATQYAAICLTAMGAFSVGPIIICWYIMNLDGHAERSVGAAWAIGFGNCGAFIATFSFVAADAPLYRNGYAICLGISCMGVVAAALYAALIWRENKKARIGGPDVKGVRYYGI